LQAGLPASILASAIYDAQRSLLDVERGFSDSLKMGCDWQVRPRSSERATKFNHRKRLAHLVLGQN